MEKALEQLWSMLQDEIDSLGTFPERAYSAEDFKAVAEMLTRASRIAFRYAKKARKLERVLSK